METQKEFVVSLITSALAVSAAYTLLGILVPLLTHIPSIMSTQGWVGIWLGFAVVRAIKRMKS